MDVYDRIACHIWDMTISALAPLNTFRQDIIDITIILTETLIIFIIVVYVRLSPIQLMQNVSMTINEVMVI